MEEKINEDDTVDISCRNCNDEIQVGETYFCHEEVSTLLTKEYCDKCTKPPEEKSI